MENGVSEHVVERKEWQGYAKDANGEIQTVDLTSITYRPDVTDAEIPSFISQAAPTVVRPSKARPRARTNQLLADIPDLQYGYRRLPDGTLLPTHNPDAMDVTLQLIKDAQPNQIILGGDELDLPELSHFPPDSRHFVDTLQTSIDGLHKFFAQLRADNPNARIRNVDSNHIKRMGSFMLQHALPLFGVRRANMPDDWPVMSYAHLLRLDELGIEWESGYPAAEMRINDRLTTIHGDRSNARGSTAAQYLSFRENSLLFHHTHRAESLERTMPSGRRLQAFSFGALTGNEGATPSHGSAVSDKGDVVTHRMNWQTGMGFVEFDEGDKPFQPHAISIDPQEGHVARWNGKDYTPRANSW